MKDEKERIAKAYTANRTEEIIGAAFESVVPIRDLTKRIDDGETYRGTPKMAITAIERTIGRRFNIQEIGWFYHTLHLAVDGIDERQHTLEYDSKLFRVIFNSELTTIIRMLV